MTNFSHQTTSRDAEIFSPAIDSNLDSPYVTLAETLDALQYADGEYRSIVQSVVIEDAHNLASRLLPLEVVDELGLHAKHMDDIGFEGRPNLRGLILLVRSYDATQDKTLGITLEHILNHVPPYLSEEVVEAFKRAQESKRPIMDEFVRIAFAADQKIDGYVEGRAPFPST